MPYDGFVMNTFLDNVSRTLQGSILRNVYYKKNVFYFSFQNRDLKISLNPNYSYITFEKRNIPNDTKSHYFLEYLRSRIRNSKVNLVKQFGLERTVKFEIEKNDEIGTKHIYDIYIDIMGKHSNIIIVENGKILDAYKRIKTRYRNILPGEDFKLYVSNKINPLTELEKLFEFSNNFEGKISEFIYKNIQGFSKITAREVIFRAGIEDEKFEKVHLEIIKPVIKDLISEFLKKHLYIYYEKNKPYELSAFLLKHLGLDYQIYEEIDKAIIEFFEWHEQRSFIIQKKKNLENVIVKNISKIENTLAKINNELEKTKDYDKYRKWGELLKAYFYEIDTNLDLVELVDWETGEKVEIPLESGKSPIEIANKYFKMYNKLKTKIKGLIERKKILERELDYLYQLWYTLNDSEKEFEINEIQSEMIEIGLIKEKKKKIQTRKSEPRKVIYNGYTIIIGKNNKQNDELVRNSSDDDLWFHAHEMPGAHVVIKNNKNLVDEDTIIFAAQLAAGYSKGKNSSKVPVDYTKIKYVRKTKGLKPGMVLYSNYKTLYVNPRRLENV
ncbi:MAG: NFACT family protein [Thermosipho sp. (in: Bacteria)]|nr:NFACT family protein [Thermosipho sp. (in: thermotogales)]